MTAYPTITHNCLGFLTVPLGLKANLGGPPMSGVVLSLCPYHIAQHHWSVLATRPEIGQTSQDGRILHCHRRICLKLTIVELP